MRKDEFKKFAKRLQKQGTMVVGMDYCQCPECKARRAKGDIKPPVVYPAKPVKEEEE